MSDTKGVRQVLEVLWAVNKSGRSADNDWARDVESAEAALQEIMLGMLPEKFDMGDKLAKKALGIEFMGGYNQAIRDTKSKLIGGSNGTE